MRLACMERRGQPASSSSSTPADAASEGTAPPTAQSTHRVWGRVELSDDSSDNSLVGARRATGVTFHDLSDGSSFSSHQEEGQDTKLPQLPATSSATSQPRAPEWSEGAKLHEAGECRPCAWHWKESGCVNGANCDFCHLCDEAALALRRKERLMTALKAKNPTPQQLRRRQWARRCGKNAATGS
mmetsp:Transcript_6583/g.9040  ORF Transcript_6583/g.9040 Transcript_6583/m.9040 type:complete len:185 (-) Transcript_6583:13-567(-)